MSKHAEDRRRAAEEIELGSRVTDYAGWVDKDRNDDKSNDESSNE